MAYTRVWNETTPVGSTAQASDIDLIIQQLKQDIRERMNTIVTDWTTDPITSAFPARGVSVYNSALHSASVSPMVWNTARYDTDAFHVGGTGGSALTVPTNLDGVYIINARMVLQSTTTVSVFELQLKKNGTTVIARDRARPASTGLEYSLKATCVERLVATDYVEAFFLLLSGGGAGNDSGGIDFNGFEMIRIGP